VFADLALAAREVAEVAPSMPVEKQAQQPHHFYRSPDYSDFG
jgi:hypothetical protein